MRSRQHILEAGLAALQHHGELGVGEEKQRAVRGRSGRQRGVQVGHLVPQQSSQAAQHGGEALAVG